MRKGVLAAAVLILVCLSVTAYALTPWYVKTPNGKSVNIRDDRTGKVIGTIPYGTAVYANEDSTELAAYVHYNGTEGYVSWKYLVKEKPEPYKQSTSASSGKKAKATEEPQPTGEGEYTVSVTGGVLQFPNKKGKAAGKKYSEVRFDDPTELVVTASVPKGKKVDYWLINGIKLKPSGKTLTVIAEGQDLAVEIVYK